MEILILAVVTIVVGAAGFVLALRSVERTVGAVVDHLKNTIGGKPTELLQREIALREKQAEVEVKKAEVEIKIRELGFENEQKLAAIRLKGIERSIGENFDVES